MHHDHSPAKPWAKTARVKKKTTTFADRLVWGLVTLVHKFCIATHERDALRFEKILPRTADPHVDSGARIIRRKTPSMA